MYIVTGACGFIGANIVKALNGRGITNVIAVDNMSKADKFKNLVDCEIADYLDKREFIGILKNGGLGSSIEAIFHQGACSDTMETDGCYMMDNNFRYSLTLLDFCLSHKIQFLYASSASVYGASRVFKEARAYEEPLNVYGYSKFLFDQVVRRRLVLSSENPKSQVVGFRYFNVYGPREQHKGRMASVAFHHFNQYRASSKVELFEGCEGYGNGEQCRDFVYIDDVVNVNMFFLDHPEKSGIFNLGSGHAQPFNDIAHSTVNAFREIEGKPALTLEDMVSQNMVDYIDFPESLKGKYQSFTEADISALRAAGYVSSFNSIEEGVKKYVAVLLNNLNS